MSLEFEYVQNIPGTCIKAEIHDKSNGWWTYFLTNTETGANSGVHDFFIPMEFPVTHNLAARIALELWIAKGIDT